MVFSYIARISLEQEDMALAELEAVFDAEITSRCGRWVFFSTEQLIQQDALNSRKPAMTAAIHALLTTAARDAYAKPFSRMIENSYKLNVQKIDRGPVDTMTVADTIYHACDTPHVNIHTPDNEYLLLFDNERVHLARTIPMPEDDLPGQGARHLPYTHPTYLNPRLSRAIVNISGAKQILDPFCGVGGVLLEAGLVGCDCYGGDISEDLAEKAKKNLSYYGLDAAIEVKDARTWSVKVQAIVTDLPFGRNSFLSEGYQDLFSSFFRRASHVTDRIVVGTFEDHAVTKLIDKNQWKVTRSFKVYVHRSMTRYILVLDANTS